MNITDRLNKLIYRLAPGNFVSGEELATDLMVTRTSISKDIQRLQDWGANIFTVKGRGYKLADPFVPLNSDFICELLGPDMLGPIHVLTSAESTNNTMKANWSEWQQGEVIIADIQTKGRGRRGREWIAPIGSGLTFSLHWAFESGHQSLAGLPLVVGCALCRVLREFGVSDAGVKWPNDIYVNAAKAGGVLVELEGQLDSAARCIIGVGLNVALPNHNLEVDQPITDVQSHTQQQIHRNELVAQLIAEMWKTISRFEEEGFSAFKNEWESYDIFNNQEVTIVAGERRFIGTGVGVDEVGALKLKTNNGIERFHGGEVSLRGTET